MSARLNSFRFRLLAAVITVASAGFVPASALAAEIPWSTDIESSLRESAQTGKPVLLEFTASWCVYCKRMEKTTFVDPDVVNYVNERFIPVRVDADQHKQLVADLAIKGLPAILVVSPDLKVMERIPGFQTPEALLTKLDRLPARQQAEMAKASESNSPKPAVIQKKPARRDLEFEAIEPIRPAVTRQTPGVRPVSQPTSVEEESEPEFESLTAAQKPPEDLSGLDEEEPESEVVAAAEPESAEPESAEPEADEQFFATISQETRRPEAKVPAARTPASKSAAFEGACIVSAIEEREISIGSPSYQINYRGQLLFFSSEENKEKFLAQPGNYWPMLDGACAMTLLNEEKKVQGQLEYAAFFRKRLWVFTSEENMKEFLEDPAEVAEEVEEVK